jgi:Ca2+-binding EF-hand superfamily protein
VILAQLMRTIKSIDKDNNGYVTSTELDDILKLTFPEELERANLKPIFREFESL